MLLHFQNVDDLKKNIFNSDVKVKKVPELPEAFTNVLQAYIKNNPNPPPAAYDSLPAPESIQSHLKQEFAWLKDVYLTEDVDRSICPTTSCAWKLVSMGVWIVR